MKKKPEPVDSPAESVLRDGCDCDNGCNCDRVPAASVLVVELPEGAECYLVEEIKQAWTEAWDGKPPIPVFVAPPGCSVGVLQVS